MGALGESICSSALQMARLITVVGRVGLPLTGVASKPCPRTSTLKNKVGSGSDQRSAYCVTHLDALLVQCQAKGSVLGAAHANALAHQREDIKGRVRVG